MCLLFQFDWRRYLNMLFNDTSVVLNPKIDMAIITDLEYVKKLSVLLNKTDDVTIGTLFFFFLLLLRPNQLKCPYRKILVVEDFFEHGRQHEKRV